MRIHFIRHAQAFGRTSEVADELRGLSCRGRKRFRQVAACLAKMELAPDLIVTSPKVRAVQTAEILAGLLRFNGEVRIYPLLACGPDVATLDTLLDDCAPLEEVVIVGHEPGLGSTVAALLQLSDPCSLSKGGVVSLKLVRRNSGLSATLMSMVTGGGKPVRKLSAIVERLQGKTTAAKEEATP